MTARHLSKVADIFPLQYLRAFAVEHLELTGRELEVIKKENEQQPDVVYECLRLWCRKKEQQQRVIVTVQYLHEFLDKTWIERRWYERTTFGFLLEANNDPIQEPDVATMVRPTKCRCLIKSTVLHLWMLCMCVFCVLIAPFLCCIYLDKRDFIREIFGLAFGLTALSLDVVATIIKVIATEIREISHVLKERSGKEEGKGRGCVVSDRFQPLEYELHAVLEAVDRHVRGNQLDRDYVNFTRHAFYIPDCNFSRMVQHNLQYSHQASLASLNITVV